jgi:hypothetical protein
LPTIVGLGHGVRFDTARPSFARTPGHRRLNWRLLLGRAGAPGAVFFEGVIGEDLHISLIFDDPEIVLVVFIFIGPDPCVR